METHLAPCKFQLFDTPLIEDECDLISSVLCPDQINTGFNTLLFTNYKSGCAICLGRRGPHANRGRHRSSPQGTADSPEAVW